MEDYATQAKVKAKSFHRCQGLHVYVTDTDISKDFSFNIIFITIKIILSP